MPAISLSQTLIVAVSGALLSLGFSYIPGLNTKFASLTPEQKRIIMVGLMVLTAVVTTALGCYKIIVIDNFTCDQSGIIQVIWNLILAIMANQATYSISPQTKGVKEAKSSSISG